MKLVVLKILISWFWIFFISNHATGQKVRVLLISMDQSDVVFDQYSNRVLRHNQVSIDSAKIQTIRMTTQSLLKEFPGIEFIPAEKMPEFLAIKDSLQELKRYVAFQYSEIHDKYTAFPKKMYWGRSISSPVIHLLKLLMQKSNCTYLLMFNQYEVTTPRPFLKDTRFFMHFELYTDQMNKLSGNCGVYSNRLRKRMYWDVFKFYQRMSVFDACQKLKHYWK